MSKFYLPYQFIPASGTVNDKSTARYSIEDIQKAESHNDPASYARHDLYLKEAYHGRMECRIYLETDTVVGNHHSPSDHKPTRVNQYRFRGKYAIPGNSIRGMIASVMEAISQSALRVLEDSELSLTLDRGTWRKSFGSVYEKFQDSVLPYGVKGRTNLTPAEALLGVIEETQGYSQNRELDKPASALQSRVRFSDAFSDKPDKEICHDKEITLKILGEPKATASQSLYYLDKNNPKEYIPKATFKADQIVARGRKRYLHHPPIQTGKKYWKTESEAQERQNLKVCCKPMRAGQAFTFTVYFENLTAAELTLLKRSLVPREDFCHKLGLGKPLGLGTVRISITKTHYFTPEHRYSANSLADTITTKPDFEEPEECDSLIDPETMAILNTLGSYDSSDGPKYLRRIPEFVPVHYPVQNSKQPETGQYQWSVENEERNNTAQVLYQVEANRYLPTLDTDHACQASENLPPPSEVPFELIPKEDPAPKNIQQAFVNMLEKYSKNSHPANNNIEKLKHSFTLREFWQEIDHFESTESKQIRALIYRTMNHHDIYEIIRNSRIGRIREKKYFGDIISEKNPC